MDSQIHSVDNNNNDNDNDNNNNSNNKNSYPDPSFSPNHPRNSNRQTHRHPQNRYRQKNHQSPSNTDSLIPPGSAALLDMIDKSVLVILRDGRVLIGILRSYDQFANLVFQDTTERIAASNNVYGDIDRGVFVIRGENVVLLGEVDGDMEDRLAVNEVHVEDALAFQRVDLDVRQTRDALEHSVLFQQGFCLDFDVNDTY